MASNDLTALRNHMFEVIERLKSNNDPEASECEKMDVETAKAITNAAQSIIHSAKIEIDFLKLIAKGDNVQGVEAAAEKTRFLASKPIKSIN
jgi:ribosomal protein S3AE